MLVFTLITLNWFSCIQSFINSPLSLEIYKISTPKMKQMFVFLSLGKDLQMYKHFHTITNSELCHSHFWFLTRFSSKHLEKWVSGFLFTKKKKEKAGAAFIFRLASFPMFHLGLHGQSMRSASGTLLKFIALKQEKHCVYTVAKIGCKVNTCSSHIAVREQKLVSHWKSLFKPGPVWLSG